MPSRAPCTASPCHPTLSHQAPHCCMASCTCKAKQQSLLPWCFSACLPASTSSGPVPAEPLMQDASCARPHSALAQGRGEDAATGRQGCCRVGTSWIHGGPLMAPAGRCCSGGWHPLRGLRLPGQLHHGGCRLGCVHACLGSAHMKASGSVSTRLHEAFARRAVVSWAVSLVWGQRLGVVPVTLVCPRARRLCWHRILVRLGRLLCCSFLHPAAPWCCATSRLRYQCLRTRPIPQR